MNSNRFESNTPVFTNPLSEAQEFILSRFLVGIMILIGFRVTGIFANMMRNGSDTFDTSTIIVFIILLTVLALVYWNKQWSYQLRSSCLLTGVYIIGVEGLIVERLVTATGQFTLIAFIVLVFILAGTRIGIISAGITIGTIWIVGYSSRELSNSAIVEFYTSQIGFIVPILVLIVVAFAVILSIGRLLLGITEAIQQEQELAQTLERERTVLLERTLAREQALTITTEINRSISQLLIEHEIANTAVNQIQDAFQVTHVQLYKLDQQEGDLKLQAASGAIGQSLLEQEISLAIGFGPIGKAAVSQEFVTIVDPNPNEQHILPGTQLLLAIPVLYEQSLYGILLIQNAEERIINDDVQYALKLIANQVAITLRNAQQYNRARKLLLHEELVNSIRSKIQQATSIEEVLQTAASELGVALEAPKTFVKLGRERRIKG